MCAQWILGTVNPFRKQHTKKYHLLLLISRGDGGKASTLTQSPDSPWFIHLCITGIKWDHSKQFCRLSPFNGWPTQQSSPLFWVFCKHVFLGDLEENQLLRFKESLVCLVTCRLALLLLFEKSLFSRWLPAPAAVRARLARHFTFLSAPRGRIC